MRLFIGFVALVALVTASFAAEIKVGDTMHVKPNSIWFDEPAQLARWQKLKKRGDAKALAKYQEKLLSEREAWQFVNPLTVTIMRYDAKNRSVKIKMLTEGRMQGSEWLIDPDALVQ